MSILLMAQRKKYRYALDKFSKMLIAAAYGLRKLRTGGYSYACRVRDDTNGEKDIGFVGEKLDTDFLKAWLGRNQLASVPLGVDGNVNGISDGWGFMKMNSGDGVATVENGDTQKLTLTSSSNTNSDTRITSSRILMNAGATVTFSVDAKIVQTVGTCACETIIVYYNSVGGYVGESALSFTSDIFTTKSKTVVLPSNTAQVDIACRIKATVIGYTGSIWLRNISIVNSNQSAYVTTLYDQSGNGIHATQATVANQPRIVNAGVVDVDANGKPTMVFSGSQYLGGNLSSLINSYISVLSVAKYNSLATTQSILSIGNMTASIGCGINFGGWTSMFEWGGTEAKYTSIDTNQNQLSFARDVGVNNFKTYKNGNLGSVVVTAGNLSLNTAFTIGRNVRTDSAFYSFANISEIIVFATNDTQRTKLEQNQKKFYGTP